MFGASLVDRRELHYVSLTLFLRLSDEALPLLTRKCAPDDLNPVF
jgi:hypothetical protein